MKLVKIVIHKDTSQPTAGRGQGKAVWGGELFLLALRGIFAQSNAAAGPPSDSSAALRIDLGVRPAATMARQTAIRISELPFQRGSRGNSST